MDWPQDEEIRWYGLTETKGGNHLASLQVTLHHQGKSSVALPFLLDSGAVRTVVPESYAGNLIDPSQYPRQKTGMKDMHGGEAEGFPVEMELELPGYYPQARLRLRETIWFCLGLRRGLLGQASIFEQLGVLFLNFPDSPEGRRFGLFKRPLLSRGPATPPPDAGG
jgi:hypothetical protein